MNKGKWNLVYRECFDTRRQAMAREIEIKKMKSRKYVESLKKRYLNSGD